MEILDLFCSFLSIELKGKTMLLWALEYLCEFLFESRERFTWERFRKVDLGLFFISIFMLVFLFFFMLTETLSPFSLDF